MNNFNPDLDGSVLCVVEELTCPDCGCTADRHNAVNKIGEGRQVAHCGGCGACWKSEGTNFISAVLLHLRFKSGKPLLPNLTGRKAESKPNLQTIPTRTEAGEEIRKAFP